MIASGHMALRLAVGHGLGAGRVVQEVRSGILGGASWVGLGSRFIMAVQGKLHNVFCVSQVLGSVSCKSFTWGVGYWVLG